MKIIKTLIVLCFFILLLSTKTFAADDCESKEKFEIYTCRVESICEQYKTTKITYTPKDEYEEPEDFGALNTAKELYRKNVGNIYKCNLIQTQLNALKFMKKLIAKDKTGDLNNSIGEKIKTRESKLNSESGKIDCSLTEKDSIQNKFNLLKEVTYEMCRYINYLEYLKLYSKDISNVIENSTEEKYTPKEIAQKMVNFIYEIEDEKKHTYRVYPIAYYAYSDYENNFPIHYLLEIIKGDFEILRKKLYAALMPIAQVGYKIINAMNY